jgi:hypothetical protein
MRANNPSAAECALGLYGGGPSPAAVPPRCYQTIWAYSRSSTAPKPTISKANCRFGNGPVPGCRFNSAIADALKRNALSIMAALLLGFEISAKWLRSRCA